MRFDVIVKVVERLDFPQVRHGNFYLISLLDDGDKVHQAEAVQGKRVPYIRVGDKLFCVYPKFRSILV